MYTRKLWQTHSSYTLKGFGGYNRGSSNGRTPGSGPGYRGSSPCPRTIKKDHILVVFFSIKNLKIYRLMGRVCDVATVGSNMGEGFQGKPEPHTRCYMMYMFSFNF